MNEGRRFGRGGLVMVAVVGSLVAMEGVLQLGAFVVARTVAQRAPSSGDGAVVLCVGDSHTFGLPLPEAESYPSQLQARLDAAHGVGAYHVVNLGVPSVNSGFVLNRLERQLAQLRPRLLIAWVGVNNTWNAVEMRAGEDTGLAWRRWLQHSKLFRLASIVWYQRTGHQYDREGRAGYFEDEVPPSGIARGGPELPNPGPGLERDLVTMAELAREADLPIVFLGYPLTSQREITASIERAAGRSGAPFVSTADAFLRARRDGHAITDLVDERAGPHPSKLLYGYVVDALMIELEPLLASWYGASTGHGMKAGRGTRTEAHEPATRI